MRHGRVNMSYHTVSGRPRDSGGKAAPRQKQFSVIERDMIIREILRVKKGRTWDEVCVLVNEVAQPKIKKFASQTQLKAMMDTASRAKRIVYNRQTRDWHWLG